MPATAAKTAVARENKFVDMLLNACPVQFFGQMFRIIFTTIVFSWPVHGNDFFFSLSDHFRGRHWYLGREVLTVISVARIDAQSVLCQSRSYDKQLLTYEYKWTTFYHCNHHRSVSHNHFCRESHSWWRVLRVIFNRRTRSLPLATYRDPSLEIIPPPGCCTGIGILLALWRMSSELIIWLLKQIGHAFCF